MRKQFSRDDGIISLAGAVVKLVAKDYQKTLKVKQKLDKEQAALLREHIDLANDIKNESCSRAEFMLRHSALKTQRFEFAKKLKKAKKEIGYYEKWFMSEYGQTLCLGKGEYIMTAIRKEVSK